MAALPLLAALLVSQADAGVAEPAAVLVRKVEANTGAQDVAPGLSALLTERVRTAEVHFKVYSQTDLERVVSQERQAQLLGCSEESCLTELSDALGARYVVSTRVDRFGDRYTLVGGLYDNAQAKSLVQSRREVLDPAKLPAALDEIADELLAPLGVKPRVDTNLADRLDTTGFTLGLKLSTQYVTRVSQLAPGGDIELGYRVTPALHAFFQLSFLVAFGPTTTTSLVPGLLGMRYFFRAGKSFQPYVGAALGLLVAVELIQGRSDTRPSLWGQVGASYLFLKWLGITLDFNVDVLGAAIDLFQERFGLSIGLSLGVLFRF